MKPGGTVFVRRALMFLDRARAGRYPNARWLAEKEEISVPTARRVINRLRDDFAAPLVYSDADRGWELTEPDWSFPAAGLADRRELIALALALDMGRAAADPEMEQVLETVWHRLAERLSLPRKGLDRLLNSFSTDRTDRTVLRDPVVLDAIEATAQRRVIRFEYASPWRTEPPQARTARPFHVRHVDGAVYLLGETPSGGRVYNLSFIRNLDTTRETFEVSDDHEEKDWAGSFGIWTGSPPQDVLVRIGPPASRYFAGQQWHPGQIDTWDGDTLVRRMRAHVSPELVRRLLSLGTGLVWVDPPELREAVRQAASGLLDNLK